MSWQKLKSREVYRNRFMWVTEDEILTDHGDQVRYGIVHKEPAAIIIPWDGTHSTLIGQYRYAVDSFSWEWPAGHFEHENIEATARAELEEEAGLKAGKLEKIGEYFVAPGHLTQICHVYLATDLTAGERQLETSEKGMKLKRATIEEVREMVKGGEIKDGLTIVALKYLEFHLKSK